ncbi:hypothetical protein [Lactobacillus sp. PSON]|uniref:hypothetical protein n=1 Tax=Lactobacillus sp. PSON TaxID=3455454 RepID=UPI004042B5AF
MRLKKVFIGLVLAISALGIISFHTNKAEAKTLDSEPTVTVTKTKLNKEGYILRILNKHINNKIYVGKKSYDKALKTTIPFKGKTISPKKVQKIKFRIEKTTIPPKGAVSYTPMYLVASKNKKYSAWLTQASLQYYYLNNKSMHNVTKFLKKIVNRNNTKLSAADKKDLRSAITQAKKLKGSQRKFVLKSLNQIKKSDTIENQGESILLFGF